MVDNVISTIDNALAKKGLTMKAVERWKQEMPREEEMRPKDKYTMFDRKEKRYRKGIHSKLLFRHLTRSRLAWGLLVFTASCNHS